MRDLIAEQQAALERLAHSRTASARAVERAPIDWQTHSGGYAEVPGHTLVRAAPVAGRPAERARGRDQHLERKPKRSRPTLPARKHPFGLKGGFKRTWSRGYEAPPLSSYLTAVRDSHVPKT